jgi:hypothetical protein
MKPELEQLKAALQRACQAQNATVITSGRADILAMPKDTVLANIESVAAQSLSLSDEWEYRRLLELYAQLDQGLVQRLVAQGLGDANSEVREAAQDFGSRI